MAKQGKGFFGFGGKKEVTPPKTQIGKQQDADIVDIKVESNTFPPKVKSESKSEPSTELGRLKKETGLTGKALLTEWKDRKRKENGKAN